MSRTIVHRVRMPPMPANPFPDSRLFSDLVAEAEADPPPAAPTPYAFFGMTDQHVWVRCDCPWWHRLPLVSRFVHEDLP